MNLLLALSLCIITEDVDRAMGILKEALCKVC